MCTESTTAIGIRKIGIIELMMCTVKPMPIKSPIVITTVAIATSMGATTNTALRKKYSISRKIINPASGAEIPICTNMS